MRYYKWMANGKPIYGRGKYAPPGEWQLKIEGKLEICWRGYHVCTADQVPYWCGTELIEVEVHEKDIVGRGPDKILCRTWREIRRFRWTRDDVAEYARACALAAPVHASELAASSARIASNYAIAAGAAAYAASLAAAYEATPTFAAAAARRRQKAWIEDRIGEKLT